MEMSDFEVVVVWKINPLGHFFALRFSLRFFVNFYLIYCTPSVVDRRQPPLGTTCCDCANDTWHTSAIFCSSSVFPDFYRSSKEFQLVERRLDRHQFAILTVFHPFAEKPGFCCIFGILRELRENIKEKPHSTKYHLFVSFRTPFDTQHFNVDVGSINEKTTNANRANWWPHRCWTSWIIELVAGFQLATVQPLISTIFR